MGEVVCYIHINLFVEQIYNDFAVNGYFQTAILAPKVVKMKIGINFFVS